MGNKTSKNKNIILNLENKEKELQDIEDRLYEKYEKIEQMVNELEDQADLLRAKEIELNRRSHKMISSAKPMHSPMQSPRESPLQSPMQSPRKIKPRKLSSDYVHADFKKSITDLRKMNSTLMTKRRMSIS
jgi:hypothetical protein